MAEEFPCVIELNVGGKMYTTTLSTLRKYQDSMLAAMFSGRHEIQRDKDGRYMIDCDGKLFGHILEFLRFGTLPPSDVSEAVYSYAEYFGLNELSSKLFAYKQVMIAFVVSSLKARFPFFLTIITKVINLINPVKYEHIANTMIIFVNVSNRDTIQRQTTQADVRRNGRSYLWSYLYGYNGLVVKKEDQIPGVKCLRLFLFSDEFKTVTTYIAELLCVVTHSLQEHGYGKRIGYSYIPSSSLPYNSGILCSDIGYIQISKDNFDSNIDLKLMADTQTW